MSLLTVVQNACLRTNQANPTSAFSSVDTGVQQMVALCQDIGDELSERYFWRNLNTSASFTGDGSTTLFSLPSDFGQFSPGMELISSLYPFTRLNGPINNEDLNVLKALPATVKPSTWRLIGAKIEFFPVLASGEVVTYSYYSKAWVQQSGGAKVSTWTADTDVSLVDELVLTRGLVWRWLRSKGLDYAEEFGAYERSLERAVGRDNSERMVRMANSPIAQNAYPLGIVSYP